MDIITIVLILLVIGAILFIYRELVTLRDEMKLNYAEVNHHLDENTKFLRGTMNNDLSFYVNKIRTLTADSIQQVRKMNILEKQPITKSPNYFSETDSKFDKSKNINNLSEKPLLNGGETKGDKENNNDGSYYMSNQDEEMATNNKDWTVALNEPAIDENNNNSNPNPVIDNQVVETKPVNFMEKMMMDLNNSQIIGMTVLETVNMPHPIIIQPQHKPEHVIECPENKIELLDNISSDGDDESLKSEGHKVNNEPIKNDEETEDDNGESINTGEIANINSGNLKPMEKYTIAALKKLAKKYNVALCAKINGKWKTLNKAELYMRIKDNLFLNK